MSKLEVSGAELYYEVIGDGPMLILIPGSNGGGDIFAQLVPALAESFRVATYDRRGFSRSKLVGSQDYSHRLLRPKINIAETKPKVVNICSNVSGAT